jgi:hypothetical protein
MANLSFTVSFGTTLEDSKQDPMDVVVYALDLGICDPCVTQKNSCWACLSVEQQVFTDPALTNPVSDGYYRFSYSPEDPYAVWYIVGGYPQPGGFYN